MHKKNKIPILSEIFPKGKPPDIYFGLAAQEVLMIEQKKSPNLLLEY